MERIWMGKNALGRSLTDSQGSVQHEEGFHWLRPLPTPGHLNCILLQNGSNENLPFSPSTNQHAAEFIAMAPFPTLKHEEPFALRIEGYSLPSKFRPQTTITFPFPRSIITSTFWVFQNYTVKGMSDSECNYKHSASVLWSLAANRLFLVWLFMSLNHWCSEGKSSLIAHYKGNKPSVLENVQHPMRKNNLNKWANIRGFIEIRSVHLCKSSLWLPWALWNIY